MALLTNNSYVDTDVMFYGRNTNDTTTTPSSQVKIRASDATVSDQFGNSVAVGCGRVVVGSRYDDDNGTDSGSAYIFSLGGAQLAKIKEGIDFHYFGYDVAVGSGRIVIGAPGDDDIDTSTGAAYIFNLNGIQLAKIKAFDAAQDDNFGWSVAVGCGRIVVGAPYEDYITTDTGSAYIFDLNGNRLAKINASDAAASDVFGNSVAVGCGRIVVGANGDDDNGSGSGSAYIFDLNGTQIAKIKASDGQAGDQFGISVAVGSGRIVVGSFGDDDLGSNSGSAYIFNLNGTQLAKIKASAGAASELLGNYVSVGSGRIVVGAHGDDDNGGAAGAAYIFNLTGTQLAKIKASDGAAGDFFGFGVAVGSGRVVVGAYGDESSGGSAYIYTTPDQPHFLDILDNI